MAVTDTRVFLRSESEPLIARNSATVEQEMTLLQEAGALARTSPAAGDWKRGLSLSVLIHTWQGLTSLHAVNSFPSQIAMF